MSINRFARRGSTIHVPITLSVVLMVLNVVLMVCWIVLLSQSGSWSALTIGTVLFCLILVGLIGYLIVTIKEIRLNERQANFIDSVTHELKSPIASLKLYLETLQMRQLESEQRDTFYNFMLKDLSRLDRLINQLLEVGRLDAIVKDSENEEVDLEEVLRTCAENACLRYKQPLEQVSFALQPAIVKGGHLALEMVFGNLLDNAFKYGGDSPKVEVEVEVRRGDRVVARIMDNGRGVEHDIRQKVFGLFYRGEKELERTRPGTGLGLYIVHTLVRSLKGKVNVQGRGKLPGAVFEIILPGKAKPCAS